MSDKLSTTDVAAGAQGIVVVQNLLITALVRAGAIDAEGMRKALQAVVSQHDPHQKNPKLVPLVHAIAAIDAGLRD